jgi:hypothetical protein
MLAAMAEHWADIEVYERQGGGGSNSNSGEQLVASRDASDVFEHHFDRDHVVRAFNEFLLYAGGTFVRVRHVVAAALTCAASSERVRLYDAGRVLRECLEAVQMAPMPRAPMTAERFRLLTTYANERALSTRTKTVDAAIYLENLHHEAHARI